MLLRPTLRVGDKLAGFFLRIVVPREANFLITLTREHRHTAGLTHSRCIGVVRLLLLYIQLFFLLFWLRDEPLHFLAT